MISEPIRPGHILIDEDGLVVLVLRIDCHDHSPDPEVSFTIAYVHVLGTPSPSVLEDQLSFEVSYLRRFWSVLA